MELRHLRYFIAVAEEGSLALAAEKRLHAAQPSLNRQIRDLEYEVGVQLMSRSVDTERALSRGAHQQLSNPRWRRRDWPLIGNNL
jgi:DNA-binding transcriptional LysR family regulator